MHGPICPCCAPCRGTGGVAVLVELVCGALLMVAVAAARFVSGRPLLRQVGSLDSTYTAWAPPAPDAVAFVRVVIPRTSWGRRPGWQRQAMRLLAVAVTVGFLAVPVVTVAALVGAGMAGVAAWIAWTRRSLAPAEFAATVPLRPVAMQVGEREWRWDALSQHQQAQHDWNDPAAWTGGPMPVRATARRIDRGGVW